MLQGRYFSSQSENIDYKELSAALREEFPTFQTEDAAAGPDAGKVVLDNSKVRILRIENWLYQCRWCGMKAHLGRARSAWELPAS